MQYVKLKEIAKYPTGKLNSNAAVINGRYPFFTCAHEIYAIDTYTYDGEYVLLGGNNASGDFPIFYYNGKFDAYQRTYLIQSTDKSVLTKFLYYAISLRLQQMKNNAAGTATKYLTKPILDRLGIELFEYAKQQKIISILSAYDTLIENNNKRIMLLEQMAENLYKEWFVRFRFPKYKQATLKPSSFGQIPNSFQILKMQDVISYYIGGGWGNDDKSDAFPIEAYVIRGTDFPYVERGDLSTCSIRFHKESNFKSRHLQADDIIIEISGGTSEQPVGRVALVSKGLVQRLNGAVICASFCKLVRLNKTLVSPLFFYYWMKYMYETRIIEKFQLQSTGIINFKFDYFLRKGEILLPSKEIMNAFEEQVLPLRTEIEVLAQQNQNLIKQRDILLPRLMSGKLQVK